MSALRKNSYSGWPTALLVSLLLHVLLLVGLCTRGWDAQMELYPAYMVDLLAPSASIAAPAEKLRNQRQVRPSDKRERKQKRVRRRPAEPLNEYREETIQLSTRRLKYTNYTGVIKQQIYSRWRYPELARQQHLEGQLLVEFSIVGTGKLADIRVLRSSGYSALDQGVIDALNAAKPFPPLPLEFQLDRLNIRARFLYRLVAHG